MDQSMQARTTVDGGGASGPRRWVGVIHAVVFVTTFVAGMMIWSPPDDSASDATWTAWMGDRGHRVTLLVAGYLLVVSAIALGAFLLRLSRAVDGDAREPRSAVATAIACVFVALGGLIWATVAGSTIFGSQPTPQTADVVRLSLNLGYPIEIVGAPLALACAIALLTVRGRRSGYFGAAMTVFGAVAVVACVASVLFFPMVIVLAWTLTASVILVRRAPTGPAGGAEPVGEVAPGAHTATAAANGVAVPRQQPAGSATP